MDLRHFRFDLDAEGIATLTWDMAGRSMNVITDEVLVELEAAVARVADDASIRGCVVTSGKASFSGGADLGMLQRLARDDAARRRTEGPEEAARAFFEESRRLSRLFRRLETGGKPWAAAINGLCLGGAFELALSCHHRVLADHDAARVGLPEIKVGLFPGAGGTQRVARLMATGDALQMMTRGEHIRPRAAMTMGLVHALAPAADIVAVAKAWILGGGTGVAPWDAKGFKLPSGRVHSPAGMSVWPAANAILRRETQDNYPAAKALLGAVYEGLQVPFDTGLTIESRFFAHILRSPEAAAMIRTLFVSTGALNKGARRPAALAATPRRIGVVGAGFMGAGIGYAAALAGLDVMLLDRTADLAAAGKTRAATLVSGQVAKGRATAAERDALLARITPATEDEALRDCDLVIEAVFEDPDLKRDVFRRVQGVLAPGAILATNTSTLPVTALARDAARPDDIVGIHFFSPVERMPLVEIIRAERSSDRALATAFDLVRALGKTPILVNDARGFYANRCVGAYLFEGHKMVVEGVPPAMVENAGRQAGMPVGPLSLSDEVALDLVRTVVSTGEGAVAAPDAGQRALLDALVVERGRLGRKNRKGFYDYPETGPKRLWPGLADLQPTRLEPDAIDVGDLKRRLLVAQALAAANAIDEGVVSDPREADVGSILGFGFAPFTGGTISFIEGMGLARFAVLCDDLAKRHGPRFSPTQALVDRAREHRGYYAAGEFAP